MNPLVTVIIPSFNHCEYVENAINSVLNQDYDNIELIVIDDGSTDDSHKLLSSMSTNDKLKIILNVENRGQSAVFNQAMEIAAGEYICLLPSDDWYLPQKISKQIEKFKSASADVGVVYGRGYYYYSKLDKMLPANLPLHRGSVLKQLIIAPNFIFPVTPMFKRECFEFARPDETYKAEGEAIYLKLAIKYEFDYVDEFVAVMRDHDRNTGKKVEMMYADNLRYWNEFFCRQDLPRAIRKFRKFPVSRLHRLKGLEAIMIDRRFAEGRVAIMKAFAVRPSLIFDFRTLAGFIISSLPRFMSMRIVDWKKKSITSN